ncbi:MAG: efflux RND transporter periplasmic adaptor subunit [Anaerolineaceae bacterium]|nr:efflux RND transporter periplasmic adaptor subunit [Anaerolineaceae bacterium]
MKQKKLWTGLLIVGLTFVWAFTGCSAGKPEADPTPETELEATFIPVVSATGKVLPAQWAMMSMSVGGVVDEILVNEGEIAEKDQVILRLDGTDQMRSFVKNAEVSLLSAQQQLDDFYDHQDIILAEAQMALAKAQIELDDANDNRGRKDYRRSSDTTLDGLRADVVIAEQALKDAEDDYNYFEENKSADDPDRARALSALVAVKKTKDKAVYNLNYALGYPDAEAVAEADARVMMAEANVAFYEEELSKLQNGPDPEMEALFTAQVETAEAQLTAAEENLANLELSAPFDGTIGKHFLRVNEWVNPGSPVVSFGDLENFIVETTDLSEIDVAQIQIGAIAKVTFDALPDEVSTAKVMYISPKADEGSGVNYTLRLELDEIPDGLKWGMTAFVDVEISNE